MPQSHVTGFGLLPSIPQKDDARDEPQAVQPANKARPQPGSPYPKPRCGLFARSPRSTTKVQRDLYCPPLNAGVSLICRSTLHVQPFPTTLGGLKVCHRADDARHAPLLDSLPGCTPSRHWPGLEPGRGFSQRKFLAKGHLLSFVPLGLAACVLPTSLRAFRVRLVFAPHWQMRVAVNLVCCAGGTKLCRSFGPQADAVARAVRPASAALVDVPRTTVHVVHHGIRAAAAHAFAVLGLL